MRILIVAAQFPYPPRSGFATRVHQLARHLSRGHEVTLLSYASAEEARNAAEVSGPVALRVIEREPASLGAKRAGQALSLLSSRPYSCRQVHSPAMQREVAALCSGGSFDVVQLESSLLCTLAFPRHVPLVLDEHNIEYEVFRRMCEGERSSARRAFNRAEHVRFRRFEQRCWNRVDGCAVTSEREVEIVRGHARGTPLAVVPNGVDLEYFTPSGAPPPPETVVFNGIMTYRPNVDAARHLLQEIWPQVRAARPRARLRIVGRGATETLRRLRGPGVELLDEVADIRPLLDGAAVVAVPVRIGGGTRLKVVEGLAMGRAIVSTSLGCEGIAVRDGRDLLIADDPASFARQIVRLFDDRALAERLGRAGRELVERRYSWSLAGRRLEALLSEVASRRRLQAPGPAAEPAPAASGL